jgi:hypothetical protein
LPNDYLPDDQPQTFTRTGGSMLSIPTFSTLGNNFLLVAFYVEIICPN